LIQRMWMRWEKLWRRLPASGAKKIVLAGIEQGGESFRDGRPGEMRFIGGRGYARITPRADLRRITLERELR